MKPRRNLGWRAVAAAMLVALWALLVSGFASADGRVLCIEKNGRRWICLPGINPVPMVCKVASCQGE